MRASRLSRFYFYSLPVLSVSFSASYLIASSSPEPKLLLFQLMGSAFSAKAEPSVAQLQMVTFPNQVTPQSLIASKRPETSGEWIQLPFKTEANTSPNPPRFVQIPNQGPFQLTVQQGSEFKVLDGNATDGQAVVQMPADVYEAYIRMAGEPASDTSRSLELEDPLYHLSQTLDRNGGDPYLKVNKVRQDSQVSKLNNYAPGQTPGDQESGWWKLGKRPLPVPLKWHNDSAAHFTLNFNNHQITEFNMRWLHRSGQTADLPMGIKEIGPEGGVVELPGVAKLEIPEGALIEAITIRLSQEKSFPKVPNEIIFTGDAEDLHDASEDAYYDSITPIVKIEPLNYQLLKPATFHSVVDQARVGNNDPRFSRWVAVKTKDADGVINNEHRWHYLKPGQYAGRMSREELFNTPALLSQFTYIGQFFPHHIKPNNGAKYFDGSEDAPSHL